MSKRSTINGRVKKLVLSDERVGKVAKNTYQVLSKACEIFARELFVGMSELAVNYEPSPRMLKASHLKYVVGSQPHLQFLSPAVDRAPDFVPGEKIVRSEAPKATKKRKKRPADNNSNQNQQGRATKSKKALGESDKKKEPVAKQQQQQQLSMTLGKVEENAEFSEDDNYDED